ncbi:MAG: PLxRFG domain-containing protein, partial [Comamonadaceae bacterium]
LKKKPITAADNKAVARPMFEGTLMWARDVDGTPTQVDDLTKKYADLPAAEKAQILLRAGRIDPEVLRMWQGLPLAQFEAAVNSRFESKALKPGVVWTPEELEKMFSLNAEQVSLYQEARSAIDRSIDMTARADMLRAVGTDYAGMRDLVLQQANLSDAMKVMTDTLQADARENPDQAERLLGLNNAVVKSYERAKELQDFGYAPLSRFGRYTVDVVDAAGERQYFGMFESMRDANQMRMRMASTFPGATVTSGTMSQEAFKLFQGITPESLEQFGSMLGLSNTGDQAKDKAFQAYLQLAKNNHSALKRLIHRKGIAGYSEDVGRVLASFVYSNARLGAGGLNAGTLETAIEGIPKEQGELRDVAMGLRSYIQDPQEEGQAVRGMLFAQYLGGSVASALVNMTQPFQITMPWLSQYGGMRRAGTQLAAAVRDMARGGKYEEDLAQALQAAEDDGVVSPQEIHQLMAQSRGTGSLRTGDGTRAG